MEPTSSQTTGEFYSRRKQEKANCAVCDDVGDGCHFGAEACRACAAFFRRTVALGKEYECRQSGDCTVNTIVRSICKYCRLNKCLEVGMRSSCVQQKRDITKKEKSSLHQPDIFMSVDESASTSAIPIEPQLAPMPILDRMRLSYEKLEKSRNVVHRKEGDNIFEKKIPSVVNFRTTLIQASNEVSLVADWVEWCFEEFHTLAVDQKSLLFLNFAPTFMILERAYLTSKYGKKNQLVLPSRDYLQYDRLEEYFTDAEHGICGKKLAKLFQPSVELNENLHDLLRSEKVELYDFFALTVLIFWDHGLVGQSEECTEVSRNMKLAVAKEYLHYRKYYRGEEDPAGQMAVKVSILTCLQRVSHRFREDMSLAHVFDVYTIPANLYNLIVGRYS
ncbi:unnamed protein product [Caenorhabditis brenneri]